MADYRLAGIATEIASEVRASRTSPGYGHPVHRELATGTGPCRSCLGLFRVGREDRLLFTYQPDSGDHTLGAPGPVFIHATECARYEGSTLPTDLTELSLLVEGRTRDGRTLVSDQKPGKEADDFIRRCLDDPEVDFVALRHGEAGCFITRIDRV